MDSLGGFATFGQPVTATGGITAAVVAPATVGITATVQTFAKGAIYSITSGTNRNKIFGVTQPMYDLYIRRAGSVGQAGAADQRGVPDRGGSLQAELRGRRAAVLGRRGPERGAAGDVAVRLSGALAGSTLTLNLGSR